MDKETRNIKENNNLLINKLWINIKIITIYTFGSIFYYWSLAQIDPRSVVCFREFHFKCFYIIAELVLISSITISISIYLIVFYKLNKFHIFNIFIIYSYFYYKDHDNGLAFHGIYNFLLFIFLLFLLLIIFCYSTCIFYFSKKLSNRYVFFIILFLIPFSPIFIFFKIFGSNHFSCNNWAKGLNNTYIDNTSKDYPCLINIPKNNSCYLTEIGPFFDISSKYRPTCLNDKLLNSQRNFFLDSMKIQKIKYLDISDQKCFGYPITTNDKFSMDYFGNTIYRGKKRLFDELNNNIILMDLYKKNKAEYYPNETEPEIYIKFENGRGNVKVQVHRNETLIKEKEEEKKKNHYNYKNMFTNVIVMFFDTISRVHFFRKLPKTSSFLNKFSGYEPDFSKKQMTIFQFFKYNSIKSFTDPNLRATYFGANMESDGTFFADYFRNKGYILGRASTYCEKSSILFWHKNLRRRFNIRWDHDGTAVSCIKGTYRGFFHTYLYSLIKKCMFGKQIIEYAIEYLESFMTTYFDYNKMFLFESGEAHEPTGQIIGYFDDIFFKFLNKLYSQGFFTNTTIVIFADHGQHLNGPLYLFNCEDFKYERTLPLLFLLIPNTHELYEDSLYETIKNNQQVFITPFDIYYTLIHIALGDKFKEIIKNPFDKYGESLFKPIDYKLRYCESPIYDSQIKPQYCICKKIL